MGTPRRQTMERGLAAFLRGQTPREDELVVWGNTRLRVRSYLIPDLPPLEYVASVRAIITQQGAVLVVRDQARTHIWPGGRRNPGETVVHALRRQVLEQTGWTVEGIVRLGCQHFHHLGPQQDDTGYPYPDFLQSVYTAAAGSQAQTMAGPAGYPLSAAFQTLAQVHTLALSPGERCFLDAAQHLRATTPLSPQEVQ